MSSAVTETIDIIEKKSTTPLQEVWVEDLVIGIFFNKEVQLTIL